MTFAFFLDFLDYRTIPLINSLITSLLNDNHRVYLYTSAKIKPKKTHNFEIITIKKYFYNSLSPFFIMFKFLRDKKIKNIDFLVGIDPQMIIPAYILSKIFRMKKIYISLEIYLKEDSDSFFYKYYYLCQKYIVNKYDYLIIMDEERKELLEHSIGKMFLKPKVILLPNSPLGEAKYYKSHYLHKKLNLNFWKKILLNPGEITERSYARELSVISNSIADDCCIVLHSRRERKSDSYIASLLKCEKTYFSMEPVKSDLLNDLFGSAFIGLVFYKTACKGITAKNLYFIGKSSGKLSYFLKNGIPVILSNLPYFQYLQSQYLCGICIKNMMDINDAIKKITINYDKYSEGAINCFNKELNFDNYYNNIHFDKNE